MPSFDQWDILVRTATIVAAVVGVALPGGWRRRAAPVARRPWAAVAVIAGLSLAVNVAVAVQHGIPRPRVHDEFSYLLAADTFAQGRLTAPTPACPDSFQSPHVLVRPTYASKYPPGQAVALATGQWVGRPVYGVWLSCGLAAVAVWWMLRAMVEPEWALLGGVVTAAHPTMVDWGHVYWGGGVAVVGGAVVVGAWARLVGPTEPGRVGPRPAEPASRVEPVRFTAPRRPREPRAAPAPGRHGPALSALLLGVGLLILANSRPYEGLVLSLPLLASLAWRRRWTAWPAIAVLIAGGALMAVHNQRVTGHPLRMPFAEYAAQFDVYPKFWFLAPHSPPAFPNATMAEVHAGKERGRFDLLHTAPGRWSTAAEWARRLRDVPARPALLLVPLAAAAVVPGRARWLWATVAVFYAGLCAENWFLPHYAAPALPATIALLVVGWRRLSERPLTARAGRGVLVGFAATAALSPLAPADPALARFARDDLLAEVPTLTVGRHVVFVRYGADHPVEDEWVYNGCDIAAQSVVWARSLGPVADAEVARCYGPRHAWALTVGKSTHAIMPWTPPTAVASVH